MKLKIIHKNQKFLFVHIVMKIPNNKIVLIKSLFLYIYCNINNLFFLNL
jgi:hypothetical protein